jgi:hypothetical protein
MSSLGQTLKGYFWWTYPRGSVHYDVMVTLILLFIFLTPHWVNFRDKPQEQSPHQTEVVVQPDGHGFIYKIDAAAVGGSIGEPSEEAMMRIIEPIAGEVAIDKIEPVRDGHHQVIAYRVWTHR